MLLQYFRERVKIARILRGESFYTRKEISQIKDVLIVKQTEKKLLNEG